MDILIARGKHRSTLIPESSVGTDWINSNYLERNITNGCVILNTEYVEDIIKQLKADDIEYEVR